MRFRTRCFSLAALAGLVLAVAGSGQAATVTLTPAWTTFNGPVAAGTNVTITLSVTLSADDLAGNNGGDGNFGGGQFAIGFDPSLIHLSNVSTSGTTAASFNSAFGTNFSTSQNIDNNDGTAKINMIDLSGTGVASSDLTAGQSMSLFTFLATLQTPMLSPSTTTTALIDLRDSLPGFPTQVGDDQGRRTISTRPRRPEDGLDPQDAVITVGVASVPEPNSLALLGLGTLVAFACRRRAPCLTAII